MSELLLAHAVSKDRLPDICHVVLHGMPPGHNVAVSVRGMKGVLLTERDLGDTNTARCIVRTLKLG
jgi:hypothetical protein